MQQQNHRCVFRPGFSVENGEPVHLDRAIKRRMLHGMFLSVGLSEQLKRDKHDTNHQFHRESCKNRI